jgi:hypothetical protein
MADCGLRLTVSNPGGRNAFADLLRDRVGWHRDGSARQGGAFMRFCFTDTHTESDGILESNSRTAVVRETVCASCGRSSRDRRTCSQYWPKATRRDQLICDR